MIQLKQETLEEAVEKYPLINQRIGFKLGAKWQAERSFTLEQISKDFMGENNQGGYFDDYLDFKLGLDTYSAGEDDKRKWANSLKDRDITFKEWFEQFKKK